MYLEPVCSYFGLHNSSWSGMGWGGVGYMRGSQLAGEEEVWTTGIFHNSGYWAMRVMASPLNWLTVSSQGLHSRSFILIVQAESFWGALKVFPDDGLLWNHKCILKWRGEKLLPSPICVPLSIPLATLRGFPAIPDTTSEYVSSGGCGQFLGTSRRGVFYAGKVDRIQSPWTFPPRRRCTVWEECPTR